MESGIHIIDGGDPEILYINKGKEIGPHHSFHSR